MACGRNMARAKMMYQIKKNINLNQNSTCIQVNDVLSMVVIFVVLVFAWGTARFSILYPDNDFSNAGSSNQFLKRILLVPTFQIFGELFIESMETAQKASE